MSDLKMSCPSCGAWTNSVGQAALDGEPCPYCGRPLPARPSPVTAAMPLVERLAEVTRAHSAEWRGDAVLGRVCWVCTCGEWRGDDYDEFRAHQVRALLPVVEQAVAEALREFVGWVAINRAFNGSDCPHGQSLYNECLNAVLPTWAEDWLSADAIATTEET